MRSFALTHSAIVTALGAGRSATMAALMSGRTALKPCRFETVDIATYVGEVDGLDEYRIEGDLAAYDCRNNRLANMALAQDGFSESVEAARDRYGARRIGVFLGTSTSGILETEIAYRTRGEKGGELRDGFPYAETHNTFSVADYVRRRFHLCGPAEVISAACASTSKALGNAARMIEVGLCDAAIVGGSDSLCLTTMYGFHSLLLTSPEPCRPFDEDRDGISIGEGAGFVLLERDGEGVRLLGLGESSDAHHMSSPHPEGLGARLAMERALQSAGLVPSDIDYINLHGTATRVGDAAEDIAVSSLFQDTPCSSIKGYTGHTLGASGIIEAIMSALCLEDGFVPGTVGTSKRDLQLKSGLLLQGGTRPMKHVMSNSFGFGGSNCSVVLGRA